MTTNRSAIMPEKSSEIIQTADLNLIMQKLETNSVLLGLIFAGMILMCLVVLVYKRNNLMCFRSGKFEPNGPVRRRNFCCHPADDTNASEGKMTTIATTKK
ncbi:uncharacterized protein LOC120328945 isoform X2 [Styela clava]